MPPKLFCACSSSYRRRSMFLIFYLLNGLSRFVLGFIVTSWQNLDYKCKYNKPLSVSETWDGYSSNNGGVGGSGEVFSDWGQKQYKLYGLCRHTNRVQTRWWTTGLAEDLVSLWSQWPSMVVPKVFTYTLFFDCIALILRKLKICVLIMEIFGVFVFVCFIWLAIGRSLFSCVNGISIIGFCIA